MDLKTTSQSEMQKYRRVLREERVLSSRKKRAATKHDVREILEDFLEGKGAPFAWDDFTLGEPFEDEQLEQIRLRCAGLSQEFPPQNPGEYCNQQGRRVIRDFVNQLQYPTH